MPEHVNVYNASHERCDMAIGPCQCGSTHRFENWPKKIQKAILSDRYVVCEYCEAKKSVIHIFKNPNA